MSCAEPRLCHPCLALLLVLSVLVLTASRAAQAEDTFSLDAEEFAKKTWSNGGFAEIKGEHMDVRQGSALSLLNMDDDPPADLDQFSGSLQLNGAYAKGIAQLHWLLKATGQQDTFGWYDTADIYESYLNLTPTSAMTASAGKKSYKWGKGYAWNPVGFINRSKDPNNPEEALAGFITSDFEMIRSFAGDLQNIALTTVVLPVYQGVNDDFGAEDNLNLAAKLYLLYLNTDIDFIQRQQPEHSFWRGFLPQPDHQF